MRVVLFSIQLAIWLSVMVSCFYFELSVYLIKQLKGQLVLIANTQSIEKYVNTNSLTSTEKENIRLISDVKKYVEDSLHFRPCKSYTSIYNQHDKPILWAITASEPYTVKGYVWHFPVLGAVSYKGFFNKADAINEANHLKSLGYDVEVRPVSAWSTLGWLSDPILSSMLKKSKGQLCNLIIHELFHSTYYAPSSVDFNENLASFVAHKATIQFLEQTKDSVSLAEYIQYYHDHRLYEVYILQALKKLQLLYEPHTKSEHLNILKLKTLVTIAQGIDTLPLYKPEKYARQKQAILQDKNAYFVDFIQYNSLQDSLEGAFNKIYKGSLLNMVHALK